MFSRADIEPAVIFFVGMMFFTGIVLMVVKRLVYGPGGPRNETALYLILRTSGWMLIGMSLFGMIILSGGTSLILFFATIAILVMTKNRSRAARQNMLLWTIAAAAEKQMPLAPTVVAFGSEHHGAYGRRVAWLAELLEDGVPLPDALVESGHPLPRSVEIMIHVGHDHGALAPALKAAVETEAADQPIWQAVTGRLCYLCLVLSFGSGLVSFLMLSIVPKFVKIFSGFGLELPYLTRMMMKVSSWSASGGILPQVVLLASTALMIYSLLHFMGVIRTGVPVLRRFFVSIHSAVILRSLSLAAQRQGPLGPVIETLALWYPVAFVRQRLEKSAEKIRDGADWCETLLTQGLIRRADAEVLEAAERVGNLRWAMEEMAQSGVRRLAYRLQAVTYVLFPIVLLAVGLLVMLFVVGLFLPMITLINNLAQ